MSEEPVYNETEGFRFAVSLLAALGTVILPYVPIYKPRLLIRFGIFSFAN